MIPATGSAAPFRGAAYVKARNNSIAEAAMAIAKKGLWPSPKKVAEELGISEAVVDRERDHLLAARRHWVARNGKPHSQWRDPKEKSERLAEAPPASNPPKGVAEKLERYRKVSKRQRVRIRNLEGKVEALEETVRRLMLGVRPPELGQLLEAGAEQGVKREANQRVAVRP